MRAGRPANSEARQSAPSDDRENVMRTLILLAVAGLLSAQTPNRIVKGNADAIRKGDCNHLIQYAHNSTTQAVIVSAEFESSGLAAGCTVSLENIGTAVVEVVADDVIYTISPGTADAPQTAKITSDGETLSVSGS